jgi:hypothetical protein
MNPSIRAVELWFLPTDDLDADKRKDHTPKAVGSLSRLPKQNPACRFPALGSPDDFCEDLRFIPLDAMYELTAARTTVDRSDTPSCSVTAGSPDCCRSPRMR